MKIQICSNNLAVKGKQKKEVEIYLLKKIVNPMLPGTKPKLSLIISILQSRMTRYLKITTVERGKRVKRNVSLFFP